MIVVERDEGRLGNWGPGDGVIVAGVGLGPEGDFGLGGSFSGCGGGWTGFRGEDTSRVLVLERWSRADV